MASKNHGATGSLRETCQVRRLSPLIRVTSRANYLNRWNLHRNPSGLYLISKRKLVLNIIFGGLFNIWHDHNICKLFLFPRPHCNFGNSTPMNNRSGPFPDRLQLLGDGDVQIVQVKHVVRSTLDLVGLFLLFLRGLNVPFDLFVVF
jgi:hypothetical protein